jgi:hypothetical protein
MWPGQCLVAGSKDFLFQQAAENAGYLKGELDFREVLHGRGGEYGWCASGDHEKARRSSYWLSMGAADGFRRSLGMPRERANASLLAL